MKSKVKFVFFMVSLVALLALGFPFKGSAGRFAPVPVAEARHGVDVSAARSEPTPTPAPSGSNFWVEAGRWVMTNRVPIECGISENLGTVTSIKQVRNQTPFTIRLWKVDEKPFQSPTQTLDVAPNSTVEGDFWLPWANNNEEYQKHHMTLSLDGREVANIWQSGPNVRFVSGGGFAQSAPSMPGISKSGGDRALVITLMEGRRDQPAFVLVRRDCPGFQ